MAEREPAIVTRGLARRYGERWALAGLDLSVPRGLIYGLVGPNGAGKTTTLRLLAGLLEPSAGEAWILGQPATGPRHLDRLRQAIGYMPDFSGVYEDMRAWEYLDFYARCHGLPRSLRRRRVAGLLDLIGLSDRAQDEVGSLSRGMQQRLCLAHALVHDPAILLLDEPAAGLDPRARRELRALLRELRAMGKTIVVSSHVLSELAEVCDQVGIMERGRLVAGGALDALERDLDPERSAGQRVLLELLPPAEAAQALLAGLPGVSLEPDGPAAPDGAAHDPEAAEPLRIAIRVEGGAEAHAAVIDALVAAGIRVAAYQRQERDLERVFLGLTRAEVEG
ncbi:MAG: ABC transporter ATP-binding protein [Caldilineae bacterium]|nr:ABC transporter ATP-binding protein [Chloroflexota bacterium]MCB9176828.1 ABC transporter ATP-binding protein [Caldilineae bacterium]